jgi:cytosine/adenosine deaminase-related metal-dependent hydrolase
MRKADFNAEEWSTIAAGPPMAGLRVMAAERGGTLRESFSMAKVYAKGREREGESELLDELVRSHPEVERIQARTQEELAHRAMDRLREAIELIDRKAPPPEADAYKHFVQDVAEEVAHAHKEGGFLGIGGTPVSESEQRAIDEITRLLGFGTAA